MFVCVCVLRASLTKKKEKKTRGRNNGISMNDLLSSALFYRTFFCSVRRFAKIKKKGDSKLTKKIKLADVV